MGLHVAVAPPNPDAVLPTGIGSVSMLFEDLYARHLADVFRYALVLTGSIDEAEDIAAETFARAWRAWSGGAEPDGPPLPWLLVIARNIATDRWRRLKRVATRLLPVRTPDAHADVEAMLWVESLVRILPPRQRELIALRYYRDLDDGEIGRLMGITESGVRSLASRALATLRRHPELWR